jgi:3-hydroxyacyl-[acyl-carrier-protein] dehydratase
MRWILVDKIVEMDPGKTAVGIRSFSRAELFFMDHFPGFPIVPGVLQVEMIAQVGGKCIRAANPEILPVLSSVKSAQFRNKIEPGDQALITAEVTVRKSYSLAKGNIEVNGKRVAKAEVMYAHIQIPKDRVVQGIDEALNDRRRIRRRVFQGIDEVLNDRRGTRIRRRFDRLNNI